MFVIHLSRSLAQAVRRSPTTAGVPSSRLGPSMWVSWWTKRGLGKFFTGFLPFSPSTNFIPPFSPHSSHPFRFISSALVMVRQTWSAGTLATHGPTIWGLHRISSLDPTLCWTRVEDIYFFLFVRFIGDQMVLKRHVFVPSVLTL